MRKSITYLLFIFGFASNASSQVPEGKQLLSDNFVAFSTYGSGAQSLIEEVPVTGQSFKKALHINTFNKTGKGDYGLHAGISEPLKNGDVVWISFKARSLESKRESGESIIELRFDQLINGKYAWPSHLESNISIGAAWTEISIPFIMKKDAAAENVRLNIKFDTYDQRFELSPVTIINYGKKVKMSDLPKSVVHYGGDAPNAAWRKEAAARIDKYRKGNLEIKVIDKNGKAVEGAFVAVKMIKSAYTWGTATNSNNILDTTNSTFKIYRDTLLRYFNKIVFENEMKSRNWARTDHNKTLKALECIGKHNITARGHVMVWPSWQHSPHLVPYKNEPAALRTAVLKDITNATTFMKGQFVEWDVVNEPYAHHEIIDQLGGRKVMLEWFATAKKYAPDVKLFLNEYTMFHTQGNGSEVFFNTIKYLKDNGAPIDGIGEQSHIGGTPPGIDFILEKLDHFATLGLPIQITEFDINSDDDDFKARYLRDYFTAIFSHPVTTGILQWGFWEGSHWMPAAALWDKNWNIRPAGKVYTELVTKTWATHETGITNSSGIYNIRAFNGEYEVRVKNGGNETVKQTTLDSNGNYIEVKIE